MSSDSDLVRLALSGDSTAGEELVRRWSARVLAVCDARVRSHHTAEELAQETLLRGIRSLATLHDAAKFGPWLCGIATRVCLDWLKSGQAGQTSLDAMSNGSPDNWLPSSEQTPCEKVGQADYEQRLFDEVATLPEAYREAILLYYYDDVTYADMASMLNVSTATINARLTKARAMLRERLSGLRR
jgi:RNA polymerase sigma-70 factor (ECF subfamily)